MSSPLETRRWYEGITRYQWIVLLIASLGWVFDVFEGQVFVASMNEAMPSLLPKGTTDGDKAFYNDVALGAFLLGGALGGVLFGMLSDRIGRTRTMIYTIIMYSAFTCVSAFAQTWWQLAAMRFLVAMGVGGEWAVASAMVAEVFPKRARAWSLGIFHASSVFGTYLAVAVGAFVVQNDDLVVGGRDIGWRVGFALGAVPALLTIWIRLSLREPDNWQAARTAAAEDVTKKLGSIAELFRGSLLRHTLVGVGLAAVGLATFWGAHIYGKDLVRANKEQFYLSEAVPAAREPARLDALLAGVKEEALKTVPPPDAAVLDRELASLRSAFTAEGTLAGTRSQLLPEAADPQAAATKLRRSLLTEFRAQLLKPNRETIKRWEMIGMFLVTTGGGLGLVCFGPICERIGRRGAFLFFHLGGLASGVALFTWLATAELGVLLAVLPVFGFLTLGMHAGYAIYFPELFPTRLRGTGAGFCFNFGRIIAAPVLFIRGWMQCDWGFTLEGAATVLSTLFLLGAVLLLFAPETRGEELPE